MNNKEFLSDLTNNLKYKLEMKPSFISANEKSYFNREKFKSEKREEHNTKNKNEYKMNCATTRKWSIKFK